MSGEADAVCGAPYGPPGPERVNVRNGYRHRDFDTRAGTLGDSLPCGITPQPNGGPLTVASSDQFVSQVDELQYGLNQGPCLSAARTGQQVWIDDLAADKTGCFRF